MPPDVTSVMDGTRKDGKPGATAEAASLSQRNSPYPGASLPQIGQQSLKSVLMASTGSGVCVPEFSFRGFVDPNRHAQNVVFS